MQDIGVPFGNNCVATGVNDHGQIIGWTQVRPWSGSGAEYRAFLYTDGVFYDLGFGDIAGMRSYAYGINNSGQVVGAYNDIAFLYSDGEIVSLNSLLPSNSGFGTLRVASAINDHGQIIGWGEDIQGNTHAFLMTPIPEPASILLMSCGISVILRKRHRDLR